MLTGARQTMSSWARVIESYDSIPEIYQGSCEMLFRDSQAFPYLVLAPALDGIRRKTTEKLIGEVNDSLVVLERIGQRIVTTAYPLKTVRDVETGSILLYSWITLSGMTSEGVPASSTIEFNTATSRHLAPFLNKIRPAFGDADQTALRAEQAKFDYLALASFKFMNFARESLVCGEHVIHSVWQPEIRRPVATLFGWSFYRTLSTAHLMILTDKEVILIWDDERSTANRGVRYGGVWRYIPLRHIVSVSLAEPAGDLLTLSIHLSPDTHLDTVFAISNQRQVEHLQNEIKQLIG
jgi:hypothetical protein